jgi:hypothetical protein
MRKERKIRPKYPLPPVSVQTVELYQPQPLAHQTRFLSQLPSAGDLSLLMEAGSGKFKRNVRPIPNS